MASLRSRMGSIVLDIIKIGVAVVGAAVTIGAIGNAGWKAAIVYHKWEDDAKLVKSSAFITFQDKQIEEARRELADRDKRIAELQTQIKQTPTDPNWVVMNNQMLCLLADVVRAGSPGLDMNMTKSLLKSTLDMRREGLAAGGMVGYNTRDGVQYLYLPKLPQGKWINMQTGEIVDPKP